MKLPKFEKINSERFLKEAFEEEHRRLWLKNARIRRNVYLALFIVSMICVLYTAITHWMTLCILALFLAVVSLVVMTKYDTQLHFLQILDLRDKKQYEEPDYS